MSLTTAYQRTLENLTLYETLQLLSYGAGLLADRKQATPKPPGELQMSLSAPLKELALRLPDLISKAGHSEIWGVRLSSPETHVPTQIVLQKYLNANDGDVAKAADSNTVILPSVYT